MVQLNNPEPRKKPDAGLEMASHPQPSISTVVFNTRRYFVIVASGTAQLERSPSRFIPGLDALQN
jgi:hypothetical protein